MVCGQENDITVALDTTRTEELVAEGQAREIVTACKICERGMILR